MRVSEIREQAELFGIPLRLALVQRIRYLRDRMRRLHGTIEGCDIREAVQLVSEKPLHRGTLADDFISCAKEARRLAMALRDSERKEDITDEMIQRAREYPIDRVVEFVNGKALAFCHADRNPSLTWNKKHNRAHCFPCDKSFNAVDVLIERDKMSFPDAVKILQ